MTEYDFSPEAYQRHFEKMNSISKWVDNTEHYRPEYEDAAALTEGQRHRNRLSRSRSASRRRAPPPPPLRLPPLELGMHSYESPYQSPAVPHDMEFAYAGSPGPMPSHMVYSAAPQLSLIAPDHHRSSHHDHHSHHSSRSHSRHRRRSHNHSRSSSISYAPGSAVYVPPVSAPAYGPGYVVLPPPPRHGRGYHQVGPVSYIYV